MVSLAAANVEHLSSGKKVREDKTTDKSGKLITHHRNAATILMKHYDIQRDLEHPIIELARYVLTKYLDEEKLHLVSGIECKIILKDEWLRFYQSANPTK